MLVQGRLVADELKKNITNVDHSTKTVCFVLFGNNPASEQFVAMKCRFAESIGIKVKIEKYPETLSLDEMKKIVENITLQKFSGVVVQLPLPKGIDPNEILNLVPEQIDIDVLSDIAKNLYKNNQSNMVPPVARAIEEILKFYTVSLEGKEILLVGRGRLVGEPVSSMLTLKGFDFKQIDIETPDEEREKLLKKSDIIITGAGSPHFIKPDMIKDGVVLIDAGTSEQNGKVVGDVDPLCYNKASLVTPIPGGVGPVVLASLFLNLSR